MKKFVRFASLILVLIMLSSCTAAPELLSFLPETEDKGFGGKEFVIKGNWTTTWDPNELVDETADSVALSLYQDALVAHNAKIMEEYDCKITAVFADWSWSEEMFADIAANKVAYDFMDTNLELMINNIRAGYVTPWEYANIDVTNTDKYGPSGYLEASSLDGLHYGIWPHYRISGIEFRGILGVNNNLLEGYMPASVHELYENGKWTFDEFEKILTAVASDGEVYPLSIYDKKMYMICSILANGSNLASYNENTGKYYYGMNDPKAIKAIEYAKSLYDEGFVVEEYEYTGYFIKEQAAAFSLQESWCLGGDIEGMDMTCFPFGPDAEYGVDLGAYRTTNNRYLYMPFTSEEAVCGRFIDLLFENIEDCPKESILENFKMNDFFNDESYEKWMFIATNAGYDYGAELFDSYPSFTEGLSGVVFGNTAFTTFAQKFEPQMQLLIDEYLN